MNYQTGQYGIFHLGVITTYVATGIWASRTCPAIGVILPSILGGLAAHHPDDRAASIANGVFWANASGIAAILVSRSLLWHFSPSVLYRLTDDDLRNEVFGLYALSGLVGGIIGSIAARCWVYKRIERAQ